MIIELESGAKNITLVFLHFHDSTGINSFLKKKKFSLIVATTSHETKHFLKLILNNSLTKTWGLTLQITIFIISADWLCKNSMLLLNEAETQTHKFTHMHMHAHIQSYITQSTFALYCSVGNSELNAHWTWQTSFSCYCCNYSGQFYIFPQEKTTTLTPTYNLFLLFHTLPSLRYFTKYVLLIHIINYNMNKQMSYSVLTYLTYQKHLFIFLYFLISFIFQNMTFLVVFLFIRIFQTRHLKSLFPPLLWVINLGTT